MSLGGTMVQFRKKYLIITYIVSLALVFLFANNSKVSAMEKPLEMKKETEVVYTIEKNDMDSLYQVKKAILKGDSKYVLEPQKLKEDLDNSELIINSIDLESMDVQNIEATVVRFNKLENKKVVADEVQGNVLVKFQDTIAPELELKKQEISIKYDGEIDLEDQVKFVKDNVDGVVPVVIDGEVDVKEPGKHTVTYTATDKSGNATVKELVVTVGKKPKPKPKKVEVAPEINTNQAQSQMASVSYNNAAVASGDYASMALGLVGANMHCTQLTSTVLQGRTGGYKSLSPAGTMAYTTPVSNMQPGDILYYNDAGAGVPHVAVYIGNGQAVHGGINGRVVVAPAQLGSGVVSIGRP